MLSYGAISCYSPCWFPFAIFPCQFLPFLKSLLLTWNPSFCVVRSRPPWSQVGPKLTSLSPFPPHSKFPSPQGTPSLIVRPTKTTSRSWLHIVRNNIYHYMEGKSGYIYHYISIYTITLGQMSQAIINIVPNIQV